jgi:hypothetical protein
MASAGAIRRRHSPDGGIQQWLRVKPWSAPRVVLPHWHGNQNRQQFDNIFCGTKSLDTYGVGADDAVGQDPEGAGGRGEIQHHPRHLAHWNQEG